MEPYLQAESKKTLKAGKIESGVFLLSESRPSVLLTTLTQAKYQVNINQDKDSPAVDSR